MESRSSTIAPRRLGSLLDETFAIYWKHLRRFVALVALVQVPISLISLAMFQLVQAEMAILVVALMLGLLGTVFAYGSVVFAVGQHYVSGGIEFRRCYARVWLRVLSLGIVTSVFAAALLAVLIGLTLTEQPIVASLTLVMVFPVIAVAVYWSMAVQAVIVENYKAVGAFKRSFALIRGSWWRIFGITVVLWLVAFGLAVTLTVLFVVASLIAEAATGSGLQLVQFLGNLVVGIVVPPVLFIAGTLLYYDMRVRKEHYNLSVLSQEMGAAAL